MFEFKYDFFCLLYLRGVSLIVIKLFGTEKNVPPVLKMQIYFFST